MFYTNCSKTPQIMKCNVMLTFHLYASLLIIQKKEKINQLWLNHQFESKQRAEITDSRKICKEFRKNARCQLTVFITKTTMCAADVPHNSQKYIKEMKKNCKIIVWNSTSL